MKFLIQFFVLIGLGFQISVVANAETTDIFPTADATAQSNGAKGQKLVDDAETVQTSMSGGSAIRDGLFEFDLSLLPSGATVTAATLQFRTAQIITNTAATSPVEFYGFAGDGTLDLTDQSASATMIALEVFTTGVPNNTDVTIDLSDISVLNDILNDSNPDDFLTVRSETQNFVLFLVHSLEATSSDAAPAMLSVTFTGGIILGDVNEDCNVNLLDVAQFVAAVASGTFIEQADVNEDGSVDLLDVQPFVELLTGA